MLLLLRIYPSFVLVYACVPTHAACYLDVTIYIREVIRYRHSEDTQYPYIEVLLY